MPTITLCEQRQLAPNQFEATLRFEGGGSYPVTITNPFSEQQETQLEWYFEGWLRRPFLNQVTADQIRDSIPTYGETLFDQVFADRKAYGAYIKLRSQLGSVEFVIESASPEFQALHWEALKDPDLPRSLALDCTMVRRPRQGIVVAANPNPSSTINLLVVTARPDEERDVNYRTISRPLIEAIQQARVPINVELLRPGTYEALENHLQEKGTGYYHIVHFDAHGGLAKFEQITSEQQESSPILFKNRYGRGDIKSYPGVKAFLFLEGETPGRSDPVEAQELANLLVNQGIPVCILNACQSAKQIRNGTAAGEEPEDTDPASPPLPLSTETSLGSRLMTAGMQMVVAMGYSVTVTAATILMEKLYGSLFAQKPLAEAIRLGRRELHNRKTRKGWFNMTVDLEDWLLPVVYGNQAVQFDLQEMSAREKAAYYQAKASRYRFTPPTYGFVGRDLEILKIEKSLLRHNILLLRGMGGTGKTTLLNYLREWWQTTQFARDIFYFGYDKKAYTLEQIIQDVGQRVYDEFEWSGVQPPSLDAKAEMLADTLRSEDYVLMLDNLESVTGQELAIQNTLPEAERNKLKGFLQRLVGGRTKVVLGSRSGEDWLAQVYRDNRYALQGLDSQSRTELAEKILEKHVGSGERVEKLRQDKDFERLMKLLAGYPLAMEVVLANLGQQSPSEILAALDAADVNLDSGSGDKTQSIVKCVEYSHSNLSPEAQKLLLCLAPFRDAFDQLIVDDYIQELQALEAFQTYDFSQFHKAIQEAIDWGLLSTHESGMSGFLRIQPVLPYFLRAKLAEMDEVIHKALNIGFQNLYKRFAINFEECMDSNNFQNKQLGIDLTHLEYENLYSALNYQAKVLDLSSFKAIGICLSTYLKLTHQKARRKRLNEILRITIEKYSLEFQTQEVLGARILFLDQLAHSCYQDNDFQKAGELYELLLEEQHRFKHSLDSEVVDFHPTYHQLGVVAEKQRQFEKAQYYYKQALDRKIESGDRFAQASTYQQLGVVAMMQGQYSQAQQYLQQALDIKIEFQDRSSQADTLCNMGNVEYMQQRYEPAQQYYHQALDIYVEVGDLHAQLRPLHQMGMLAQAQRQYGQAQEYYQQVLDITIKFGDRYEQADTYYQLGIVAQAQRQYEQAQQYYQQALDIKIEVGNRYSQACTYSQLGLLAEDLENLVEAGNYHIQDLQICVKFKDEQRAEFTLSNLQRIYQKTKDEALLTEAAKILNTTPDELKQAFESSDES